MANQRLQPKVSVYIPVYNGARYLRACIDGLLRQSFKPDEILVIDDGSLDATASIARSYGDAVRLIQHPTNLGLATARNNGLKEARNALVASLDVDCVPSTGWLGTLTMMIQMDPNIAGVGGNLFENNRTEAADRYRATHMSQSWGEVGLKNPAFLFGANAIYRRDAIAKAGYYDPVFRTNGEDVDMCAKLRHHGYDLIYEPRAFAYHYRKDNVASVLRMNWQHWRNPYVVYKPHESTSDLKQFLALMCTNIFQNFKQDIKDRDLARACISILSLVNFPIREIKTFLNMKRVKSMQAAKPNSVHVNEAGRVG